MSNYKNATFPNSTEGFKSWCRTFKHLFNSDIVKTGYYKKDNYYLELNKVNTMNMGGGYSSNNYYLSISLRKYNEIDKDFEYVSDKQILKLFDTRLLNFCEKNGLMKDYYEEMEERLASKE